MKILIIKITVNSNSSLKINMKIMITGGMGFIGSHLCDALLQEKHEVIVVTRNDNKKQNVSHILDRIKIEYVDMTDYKELENCIERNLPECHFSFSR